MELLVTEVQKIWDEINFQWDLGVSEERLASQVQMTDTWDLNVGGKSQDSTTQILKLGEEVRSANRWLQTEKGAILRF